MSDLATVGLAPHNSSAASGPTVAGPSRQPTSILLRPEQALPRPMRWFERPYHQIKGWGGRWYWRKGRPLDPYIKRIKGHDERVGAYNDAQLREAVAQLRSHLLCRAFDRDSLCLAFALIREVAGRSLGMRHFESQLRGGLAMFQGRVAEMATGEGKTLTATLPVAAAALAGIPVHIITVNDYLAARDAEEMTPLYEWLGLSVGCIQQGMSKDERRDIYALDIVYCTNKELVFDYLKDYLVLKGASAAMHRHAERLKGNDQMDQQLMLRGLHFAIVDEADSVFMDEARTPLIISGETHHNEGQEQVYQQAVVLARQLQRDTHFEQQDMRRQIQLTAKGEAYIDQASANLGAYWVGRIRRYEIIRQALTALIFFERDRHYLVRDGKVQIIDSHTGRVMPDRTWERGLHQLIETKEGCELTAPRETLAKISYQNFFRRYHWLAGMTGTAREVVGEFWKIYNLPVVDIPTHHPLRRQHYPDTLCATDTDKQACIAEAVAREVALGRSVLVGSSTVSSSELIGAALAEKGLQCRLLNAKQDAEEAALIAAAGQPGQVTIATSMAGRGTDIKLHSDVHGAGGLHVILTELQEASRIDRQLAGRGARFGDPGSVELIVSMDDEWLQRTWYRHLLVRVSRQRWGQRLALFLMRRRQARLQTQHSRLRQQLLKVDSRQGDILAFTAESI
ncbi:MAG: prepilin peptidase [Gammaproteobacteria bacterium]|nr:prepilin peptidase [Gammaproteobacteria bacterium]MBQ0838841.1 prepilin peptidase [Gammaproteobacteria bacterium]